MISKEEVEHIAKLARLELTPVEIEKMQKDLSAILDYFDLLKRAPKSEEINLQKPGICTRKDEIKLRDASLVEKLIAAAPNKKDDYIKVKAIL
jgi:aspartyl-tRNA(Asn)/glutamyl-tRNA(Gln) amidotransferase subunit C